MKSFISDQAWKLNGAESRGISTGERILAQPEGFKPREHITDSVRGKPSLHLTSFFSLMMKKILVTIQISILTK